MLCVTMAGGVGLPSWVVAPSEDNGLYDFIGGNAHVHKQCVKHQEKMCHAYLTRFMDNYHTKRSQEAGITQLLHGEGMPAAA